MKYCCILNCLTKSKLVNYATLNRQFSSKLTATAIIDTQENKVDKDTLVLLERLSLVKFDTAEGVKVLQDSINFADKILHINTDNVQPLYSVLENENLNLRPDRVFQGKCQKEILKNAMVTEDEYFIAPPGNIPLN